jgi:hypothetical protein
LGDNELFELDTKLLKAEPCHFLAENGSHKSNALVGVKPHTEQGKAKVDRQA